MFTHLDGMDGVGVDPLAAPKSLQETLQALVAGKLTIGDAYYAIATEMTNRISNAYMQGYDDGRVGLDDLFGEDE